jgi:mannosyltransferase
MSTSEYPARGLDNAGTVTRPRLIDAINSASVETWAVIGLIAVAAVIRIIAIDNQSFWMDEALTAFEARSSFGGMLGTVLHVETTPPLYFVLIWVWAHLFGSGEVALRSISTLSGIALVPITYLAGKELVSRRVGVLAAAFVTVNPFMIWYSQEARAYMLLTALCGASFLWFIRARRAPTPRNLARWTIWSALALMTHFFAGFLVAPEALWLLWVARSRVAGGAIAVIALIELAMVPFAVSDTSHGANWIASVPRNARISSAILEWGVSILYRRATVNQGLLAGAALLVILAGLVMAGGDSRTRRGAGVTAVLAASVFLAPLALGFLGQDYFLSRNVMPALVPVTVLVAAACLAPRTRLLGGLLAGVLIAMFSWAAIRVQTELPFERPHWRSVARALGPATVPRAVLAAGGTTADPLKIYLPSVTWVQPPSRRELIREVDVVGASKPLALIIPPGAKPAHPPFGSSPPRSRAPRGARLLARFRVYNWVVARFALDRPIRVTTGALNRLAPRFFRRTPQGLLIFFQRTGS